MSHHLASHPMRVRRKPTVLRQAMTQVGHYLRLTFVSGPKLLLTSRISPECALIMILMCLPSLMCSMMFLVPAFIFKSPHQQAYFYFSRVLDADPNRWLVLLLAGICSLLSLAIPATIRPARKPLRY